MLTIVIGAPNAGKGTLIGKLPKDLYQVIETGKQLRSEVKNQTELGKMAKPYMDAGKLVPDDLIIQMVVDAIQREQDKENNVILDGFPRTVGQAEAMIKAEIIPDLLVYLAIDKETVVARAADRQICSNCGQSYTKTGSFRKPTDPGICDVCGGALKTRSDEAKIAERYDIFVEETVPVIEFLRKNGVKIRTLRADAANVFEAFLAFTRPI